MKSDYTFDKILGEGAFGVTWKAQNKLTGEYVAIKIYKPFNPAKIGGNYTQQQKVQMGANKLFSQFRERISEEEILKTLLAICSSSAPCFRESFVEGDKFYIVMDLLDGWNVWDAMCGSSNKRIPLDERTSKYYGNIIDIVTSISQIHALGLAHQDIKGENIMFDKNSDTFKFIDFGLSCILKNGVETNLGKAYSTKYINTPCGSVGTPLTLPPEMLEGLQPAPAQAYPEFWLYAHDIWSVGCVLFTWFLYDDKLSEPMDNDDLMVLYFGYNFSYKADEYTTLFEELKDKFPKLHGILMICFQRDPQTRINLFRELAKNLEEGSLTIPDHEENWDDPTITAQAISQLRYWQKAIQADDMMALNQSKKFRNDNVLRYLKSGKFEDDEMILKSTQSLPKVHFEN